MWRNLFCFFTAIVAVLIFATVSLSNDQIVFGPKPFLIGKWHVHLSNHFFTSADPGDGSIAVTKIMPDKRINSGFILFNRKYIPLRSFLRGDETIFQQECRLKARNRIVVFLRGKPGASVSIAVRQAGGSVVQPEVTFSADPETILSGESTTLSWTSSNADSCVIDPDIGTVTSEGSVSVSPTQTTTYTITATGAGGTAVASVDIIVTEQSVPIITLDEAIITIVQGQGATLSWTSVGGDFAHMDNGIGTVSTDGTITVNPEHTTIYTLTVIGTNGSASATIHVYVNGDPISPSEGTWGHTYGDKIPADATVAAYDEQRFAMVVGEVMDIDGQPIEGVRVHIHHHLEYGSCTTDADGRFSLPVDGGALMTVVYEKDGLITSHRKVHTPWNDFVIAETVTMLSEDPAATTVIFNGNSDTIYTHQSTAVSDDAGTRAATLVFTGDNQAYLVDENDAVAKNLNAITVRATEYTTPDSMPAELPATSAYTYCTELTVDGAARVRLENPIVMWVDNFIGFDVGEIVPVGSYDRDRGVWIAEENGVVVRLLDTDSDGIVDALDADGDDLPDDLDADGNYTDEVEGLGDPNTYIAGNTYWRAQVSHFTPWDCNWPYGPPADAIKPKPDSKPVIDEQCDDEDCKGVANSYVQQKSRVYHEDIVIPGTDMTLHYSSNRAKGSHREISIPASGKTVPGSLQQIVVEMQVAGNQFQQTFDPLPSQIARFYWNGLDAYGNSVGHTTAYIKIGFVYIPVYYSSRASRRSAFGRIGVSSTNLSLEGLSTMIVWSDRSISLAGYKNSNQSIAHGWKLSNHHRLDQINNPYTLHKGSGERVDHLVSDYKLSYLDVASVLTPFAGNTTQGYSGDDGLATGAQLMHPKGLAVDAEGNIYITDSVCHCIRKVDTDGIITTVAGNGTAGYSGDGGLATDAMLRYPETVAVDAAGNIYIADFYNFRVRKVDTGGIITTVAGNGIWGHNGDEGLATEGSLIPTDLALDSSGNLFIVDYDMEDEIGVIRRVDSEGYISTLPINEKFAGGPPYIIRGIAFDNEDNLYFSDTRYNLVLKMDKSGTPIEPIAGGGDSSSGDGGPALDVSLEDPYGITVDAIGNLYILESSQYVRKVSTSGVITTVAGNGAAGFNEQGEPMDDATLLSGLSGVAINPAGELYVSYGFNAVVGKIGPMVPYLYVESLDGKVFTEDNGLGHLLDEQTSLHLKTIDMDTGVVLRQFGYDSDRKLVTITDQFGNQTVIQRDAEGTPTAIVSPEGLTTALTVDSNQNLTRITYPDGSYYDFEYTSDGLMTAEIEPNGNRFEHVFDDTGRITHALDDEGGTWAYSRRVSSEGNIQVDVTTGEGNQTSYQDCTDAAGVFTSTITDPTGAKTFYNKSADGRIVFKTLPCGMQLGFEYGIDSEYKHKYLTKETQTTPAGLRKVTEISRTYQDTDANGVSDQSTRTVSLNGESTTAVDSVLSSQKIVTSPEGRTIASDYDPSSLLTLSVSIPGLNQTNYGYDTKGRLTFVVTGTRQVSYTYDTNGFVYSATDPELKTTYYSHDEVGRITGIQRPDGGALRFAYDANGNMTVLTNPSDVDHTHGYNGVNLPDGYQTPLSGAYTYLYDADRRLISTTFPSGKQINNVYTATRLTQVQTPEGDIDYSYICSDTIGSITKGTQSIAYTYDGRLLSGLTISGTLNQSLGYTYNNDFLPETLTYAGATQDYAYDSDNLLTGADSYTITRNAQNGLPEAVSGNALSIGRTFNGYGELAGQTVKVSGNTIEQWTLTRDDAGRIIQKTETIDGITATYDYTYDSMGRLVGVSKDATLAESYGYDLDGTRTSETNTLRGITSRTLSYSDEDHLLMAGATTYQYDLDGFLTTKTDGPDVTTYTYSSRGELLQVNLPDGQTVAFDHDPLGRRIAKRINGTITEKYLWQGLATLLAVYDGSDHLIQRFEYADARMPVAMTQGGVTYYLAYDPVGSLRAVTDGAGNVIKRVDYDSFGNILADTNSAFTIPFGFAGGLHDPDTGLIRFGYRDYDPDTGRWTSKDPIGFAGGDTDLFGYVRNDPVNLIDPTGEFGISGAVLGIALGASSGLASGIASGDPSAGFWSGAAGAVAGGIAGGAVGFFAPNASPVVGGMIGGLVAGATGGAVNLRLSKGPCANISEYANAVVFGGFQGAVFGGIGGGIISSAATVGASGTAVEIAAPLITMPVSLAVDVVTSNLLGN